MDDMARSNSSTCTYPHLFPYSYIIIDNSPSKDTCKAIKNCHVIKLPLYRNNQNFNRFPYKTTPILVTKFNGHDTPHSQMGPTFTIYNHVYDED